jgi:hypothetical protein
MIAASFKRFWPKDRLDRLKALQTAAREKGLRLVARNGGERRVFLSYIAFHRGDLLMADHWGIEDAENWLRDLVEAGR